MAGPNRAQLAYLRGATRLAFDATAGVTSIVERMHGTIQGRSGRAEGLPLDSTDGIAGLVYGGISGCVRLICSGLDAGLASIEARLPDGAATAAQDALAAAVNGVYGDHLARSGNPLAIKMGLHSGGREIDLEHPARAFDDGRDGRLSAKLLVLVHGLCLSDHQWTREGHNHGTALARALGFTPLFLRYNSGLHVADNGREFAQALHTLVGNWPRPVRELAIIGHSMGGLVARSAVHVGREAGHDWPGLVHKMVFLGTPHHGAPLERAGHWLDRLMEASPYSAPLTRLGKSRSAGISDLRYGSITTGTHQFIPLPAGVDCYAAAATLAPRRSVLSERLLGDGLVPLDSALGRHADSSRSFAIPEDRLFVGYRMGHLELLSRSEVYLQLRDWLAGAA